jgi:hypothetical protein
MAAAEICGRLSRSCVVYVPYTRTGTTPGDPSIDVGSRKFVVLVLGAPVGGLARWLGGFLGSGDSSSS